MYIGAKSGLPGESKTPDEIISILKTKTDSDDIISIVSSILKELEYKQFVSVKSNTGDKREILKRAEALLIKLEKVL